MTIQSRIATRKIGAFELLVGAFPLELVFGSTSRALLLASLAVGFYFAKREFGGEFSLLDIVGLFTADKDKKGNGTT
jgi:hypothetical protein